MTVAKQEILTAQTDEEALTEVVRFYLILGPKKCSCFIFHLALCRYVDVHITDIKRLCRYTVSRVIVLLIVEQP